MQHQYTTDIHTQQMQQSHTTDIRTQQTTMAVASTTCIYTTNALIHHKYVHSQQSCFATQAPQTMNGHDNVYGHTITDK